MTRSILFVATGQVYLEEAATNAMASRVHAENILFVVVTDHIDLALSYGVFDLVLPRPDPRFTYRDKILPLLSLPTKYTLFLDTDARLLAPVSEVFKSLGRSHLAAAHAPVRRPDGWFDHTVPSVFPEFNSGVLLMRRSWRQRLLVRRWIQLYDVLASRYEQQWDQASLRSAVWHAVEHSGMRLSVLPPEANLRTTKPWIAGKGSPVYVVHGRVPPHEWSLFEDYLNGKVDRFRDWRRWLELYPESRIRPQLPPNPS